jgi:hypothetical protein
MKGVRGVQNLPDGKCADPSLSHSHIFFSRPPKKHGITDKRLAHDRNYNANSNG